MARTVIDTIGRECVFKPCRIGLPRALRAKLHGVFGLDADLEPLGHILADYIDERRQQRRGGSTQAESNAALAAVIRQGGAMDPLDVNGRERLHAAIDALDQDASWDFRQALGRRVHGRQGADHWRLETCDLEDIIAAAKDAQRRQHGKPRDVWLIGTVRRLAGFWEAETGKPISQFKYRKAEWAHVSQSAFGQFAIRFVTAIDPAMTQEQVSVAIDHVVRERNAKLRKASPVQTSHQMA